MQLTDVQEGCQEYTKVKGWVLQQIVLEKLDIMGKRMKFDIILYTHKHTHAKKKKKKKTKKETKK